MQFFASAITTLQTLVIALGAGLGVWGVVNLLEGYGSDNPGSTPCVQLSPHTAFHRIWSYRACDTLCVLLLPNSTCGLSSTVYFFTAS